MVQEHCCKKFHDSDIIHMEPEPNISYYLYKYDEEYGSDIMEDISYCPFCGKYLQK